MGTNTRVGPVPINEENGVDGEERIGEGYQVREPDRRCVIFKPGQLDNSSTRTSAKCEGRW